MCGEDLFTSDTKFESGSGWPSFYDVLEKGKVKLVTDNSMFMTRTEVLCAQVNIFRINKIKEVSPLYHEEVTLTSVRY